jgi:hypothetical protein
MESLQFGEDDCFNTFQVPNPQEEKKKRVPSLTTKKVQGGWRDIFFGFFWSVCELEEKKVSVVSLGSSIPSLFLFSTPELLKLSKEKSVDEFFKFLFFKIDSAKPTN